MDEGMQRAGNFLARADRKGFERAEVNRALVALTAPACAAAEQYRVLYHRIERFRAARSQVRVVALTSAVPGEGKSLTAANLGLVAAAADVERSVLLVDADLRRPRLAGLLGVEARPGLGEFLAGEAVLQDVVRRIPGSRLGILPAGAPRDDAGALLAGPTLRLFLEKARDHFAEIYLDVPPVLPVADGVLLAGLSDAVVLVVRAGRTPRTLVGQAIESLEGTPLLGCVLNGVETGEWPYPGVGAGTA